MVEPIALVLDNNIGESVVTSIFGVVVVLNFVSNGDVKLQSRSPLPVGRHSQNIPLKSFLHEHEKSSTPSTHFPPFAHLQQMNE